MYEKIKSKEAKIAVIGLGYVGLPIALEFAKKCSVVGFDIKEDRIEMMKNKVDPSNELSVEAFDNCDIKFTSSVDDLKDVSFFVVAVPTPIDDSNLPDLRPLLSATKTVGSVLKKGDYVVYESTVYPGCTEEDCVPVLEELSGLKFVNDFKVGFSPERINPGDKEHTIENIVKTTAGDVEYVIVDFNTSDIIDSGVLELSPRTGWVGTVGFTQPYPSIMNVRLRSL